MNVVDWKSKTRYNVRDCCGPKRQVVSVNCQPEATYVTLSCGHVENCNQIYHYPVGSDLSCFGCRFIPENVISSEPLEPELVKRGY